MAYSTVAQIRSEAGFDNNANVTNAKITDYQSAATSQINGVLKRVYTLPLASTPEIIRLIEQKLAAGHLLIDQYGAEAEGTDRDGNDRIKWATERLKEIETGLIQLVDSAGALLAKNSDVAMNGWPDSTTEDAEDDEGGDDGSFAKRSEEF